MANSNSVPCVDGARLFVISKKNLREADSHHFLVIRIAPGLPVSAIASGNKDSEHQAKHMFKPQVPSKHGHLWQNMQCLLGACAQADHAGTLGMPHPMLRGGGQFAGTLDVVELL